MDYRISVRALVEFILRSGDIERGRGAVDPQAMQKGSRLHRQLQAGMGGTYRAEVSLKQDITYDDLTLRVEGRADGIYEEDGLVWIDEIKGVRKNVHTMDAPETLHLAQAKCYALFMAQQQGLDRVGIRMSYVHLDTEEIRYFHSVHETQTLKTWFEEVAGKYHQWLSFQLSWRRLRDASMEKLDFPFTYREGQKDLVKSVWHTIATGGLLFAQAPTGTGKTMSAVFPAVRAVGGGYGESVFYLTAKTSARTVAGEAVRILRDRGLRWKTVTLTAREKLCLAEEPVCDPVLCPYAKGHYDRINEAVYTLWTQEDCFDRENILDAAQRFMVCPFELSLDLALWMDMVICDYNYVFDPDVCLKRFFGEGVQAAYIFLIDEAHNLVDRARDMYSAWLCREDVMQARRQVKDLFPGLGRS
ncbi:MAG: PD-(D/E)XK nuclease family protein, partial [Clostridia bacterium]|nr:PD-(D/E)XK nuclease family protein [Clostridia bacterium]